MPGGGIRFFKKKAQKAAETSLHHLLQPHRPAQPFTGPLQLGIRLVYPWRKTEKKRNISSFRLMPIQTRPDADNLYKMIGDVMTTLRFWEDDSQIASLHVEKFYGDHTGIGINLTDCLAHGRDGSVVQL